MLPLGAERGGSGAGGRETATKGLTRRGAVQICVVRCLQGLCEALSPSSADTGSGGFPKAPVHRGVGGPAARSPKGRGKKV